MERAVRSPDDGRIFPEPQPLLTPTRRIMGLDGQAKMSKSMGNTIGLLESPEAIWAKLRPAVTDPKRIKKTDPGTPEVCNIYHLHKAFSPPTTVEHVAMQCSTAGWGCIDCKKVLAESMETELVPDPDARRRAARGAGSRGRRAGRRRATRVARWRAKRCDGVRERMGFDVMTRARSAGRRYACIPLALIWYRRRPLPVRAPRSWNRCSERAMQSLRELISRVRRVAPWKAFGRRACRAAVDARCRSSSRHRAADPARGDAARRAGVLAVRPVRRAARRERDAVRVRAREADPLPNS